jgi:hypothetical protein
MAHSDKERHEFFGLILQSKSDRGVFVFTKPERGSRGYLADGKSKPDKYNLSVFDPKNVPPGFTLNGGYWALPRYELNWPPGDRQRLYAGGLNGVLGMPPPEGASSSATKNHNYFLTYPYEPGKIPPRDEPIR